MRYEADTLISVADNIRALLRCEHPSIVDTEGHDERLLESGSLGHGSSGETMLEASTPVGFTRAQRSESSWHQTSFVLQTVPRLISYGLCSPISRDVYCS
jgi:hypothetical protein